MVSDAIRSVTQGCVLIIDDTNTNLKRHAQSQCIHITGFNSHASTKLGVNEALNFRLFCRVFHIAILASGQPALSLSMSLSVLLKEEPKSVELS